MKEYKTNGCIQTESSINTTNRKKERVNKRPDCRHPGNCSDTPVTALWTWPNHPAQTPPSHTQGVQSGPSHRTRPRPHLPTPPTEGRGAGPLVSRRRPHAILRNSRVKVHVVDDYLTFSNLLLFKMISGIATHILLNTSLST